MILLSESLAIFVSTSLCLNQFLSKSLTWQKNWLCAVKEKLERQNVIKKSDAVAGKGKVIELLNLEVD